MKFKMLIFVNTRISECFTFFILAPSEDFDGPSAQTLGLKPDDLMFYDHMYLQTCVKNFERRRT